MARERLLLRYVYTRGVDMGVSLPYRTSRHPLVGISHHTEHACEENSGALAHLFAVDEDLNLVYPTYSAGFESYLVHNTHMHLANEVP